MKVQQIAEATPGWINWATIVGSAVLSFLQPVAALVAILWGGLQMYLAVEKRWFRKRDSK